jgi:hypothetical protein
MSKPRHWCTVRNVYLEDAITDRYEAQMNYEAMLRALNNGRGVPVGLCVIGQSKPWIMPLDQNSRLYLSRIATEGRDACDRDIAEMQKKIRQMDYEELKKEFDSYELRND